MTPYDHFAEIVKNDPGKSIRDEWMAFASWESLRYFHDDPSRTSKDAIQWVLSLNELYQLLEENYAGPGKQRCIDALETALVTFSQLELQDELCEAIGKWRAYRLREKLTHGKDLLTQKES